jgi:putative FmdB family regulatory protein
MPFYEYDCQKCGHKFENFRWFNREDKILKCPKCGAENPKRVMSTFAKSSSDNSCGTQSFG